MRTDVIFEVGNFVPPRKNFDNPQEGRGGVSGEKDSWHIILEIGDDISNTVTSVLKDNYVLEVYDL